MKRGCIHNELVEVTREEYPHADPTSWRNFKRTKPRESIVMERKVLQCFCVTLRQHFEGQISTRVSSSLVHRSVPPSTVEWQTSSRQYQPTGVTSFPSKQKTLLGRITSTNCTETSGPGKGPVVSPLQVPDSKEETKGRRFKETIFP